MKTNWAVLAKSTAVVLVTGLIFLQGMVLTAQTLSSNSFTVTDRGADYRVLEAITVENGTNKVQRYTELATGMNYTNASGQWTESEEQQITERNLHRQKNFHSGPRIMTFIISLFHGSIPVRNTNKPGKIL